MKVIIDTNGFMIPVQFNVDIFGELERLGYDEWLVPTAVINELTGLVKKCKGNDKMAARVGISLSRRCQLVEMEGFADDVILKLAKNVGASVLTNDVILNDRLHENGISVLRLRQKKILEVI